METKYFEVGDNAWGFILCYDFDYSDSDDIWAICRSFGLSDDKANEAVEVLADMNTGMTVSNCDIRMSVVFIGEATDESQWWSTVAHELWHVATAIIDYYGEDYWKEPAAYLYGELMRMVVSRIAEPCI